MGIWSISFLNILWLPKPHALSASQLVIICCKTFSTVCEPGLYEENNIRTFLVYSGCRELTNYLIRKSNLFFVTKIYHA